MSVMNPVLIDRVNALFKALVPLEGKADSMAGEIIRAIAQIGYRYYNDGDQVGIGYGRETCNPPARFLARHTTAAIADLIPALWMASDKAAYEGLLNLITEMVVDYVEGHPELRDQSAPDMWEYTDPREDQDDCDIDEDDAGENDDSDDDY